MNIARTFHIQLDLNFMRNAVGLVGGRAAPVPLVPESLEVTDVSEGVENKEVQ